MSEQFLSYLLLPLHTVNMTLFLFSGRWPSTWNLIPGPMKLSDVPNKTEHSILYGQLGTNSWPSPQCLSDSTMLAHHCRHVLSCLLNGSDYRHPFGWNDDHGPTNVTAMVKNICSIRLLLSFPFFVLLCKMKQQANSSFILCLTDPAQPGLFYKHCHHSIAEHEQVILT